MVVVVDDLSGQATAQVGFLRTCANSSRSSSDNRLLFAALMCNFFIVSYLAFQWIDQEFVSFHVTPSGNTNTPYTAMTG